MAPGDELCAGVGALSLDPKDAMCRDRLEWYDRLLTFVEASETSALDWHSWANRGACLYKLGERKASWDAYKQAVFARTSFERDLTDTELIADAEVGKFLRQLDREFRVDGWGADASDDIAFFSLLVARGRGAEIAFWRWHELLPNHYFHVTRALPGKLSTPDGLLEEACPDDSRPEFQRGNRLALLITSGPLFADSGGGHKRARLHPSVQDFCVELHSTGDGDFQVRETAPPND